jgi:hypothetical protein
MIFGFKGGYPAKFVRSPMWGYTMHGLKGSKKIDTQKRNDQLLSLGPEKSRPEMTHSKINLVLSLCTQIYIRLWIG